ncbi:MAG: hypothetical protein J6Q38_03095 [Clostridia bacterium]|nr:hypothetical protein [Clostridia bacterium]
MTVKDIVKTSAQLLNRKDIFEYLLKGVAQNYLMVEDDVNILVNAYNIVQEEIASFSFRFKAVETISPLTNGVIKYSQFKYNPLAIISVKDENGRKLDAKILPSDILVDRTAVIEYYYLPYEKTIEDESDFTGTVIQKRTLAYGVVTEYCLIKGAYEEASMWHDKYVNALKEALYNTKAKRVKGRLWV